MRRLPAAAAAALLALLGTSARAEDPASAAPAAADAVPAPAPAATPAPAAAAPGPDAPAVAADAMAAPAPDAPATAGGAPALDPAAAASAAEARAAAPDPAGAGSLAAGPDPAAVGSVATEAQAAALDPGAAASIAAPPATAPLAPVAAAPVAPAAAERKPWRTLPLIGVSLGAGFPDLANLNLLVRPLNWVRVYGGPSWGYLSWGLQGGVVLSPINWYVTPTLSFQAGKLFRTNASRLVKDDGGDSKVQEFKPLLQRLDYHYYAGDLGLELGSPRSFNFFLRFGLSFVVVKANGTATHVDDNGTAMSISDPRVSAWLPSVKLGFQYWF